MSKVAGGVTTTYTYVGLSTTVATVSVATGSTVDTTAHVTDPSGTDLAEADLSRDGSGNPGVRSTPTYLGRNGHGDVVWQADATGTISGTVAYDPFGARLVTAGSITTTQAWQSSTFDSASGLYYVIARWYSPSLGRFLSVDPVAGDGGSPQTLDRYSYGAGDSINRIDPDGRCAYNANTHRTEDTPGAPCVGSAKSSGPVVDACASSGNRAVGCGPTYRPPATKAQQRQEQVCASTAYHAAGCGPASDPRNIVRANAIAGYLQDRKNEVWSSSNPFTETDAVHATAGWTGDPTTPWNVCAIVFCPNQTLGAIQTADIYTRNDTRRGALLEICALEGGSPSECRARYPDQGQVDTDIYGGAAVTGGTATACFLFGAVTAGVACLPFAGVVIYTGATGLGNSVGGNLSDPLKGWTYQDAGVAGAATLAGGLLATTGIGSAMMAGAGISFGADFVSQQLKHPGKWDVEASFCASMTSGFAAGITKEVVPDDLEKQWLSTAWEVVNSLAGTQFCDASAQNR